MSLISICDLTFGHDSGAELLFDHATFQIDTDWRLGFVGRNGRGKTTFLKLLLGEYEYQGSISAPMKFDYFPFPVENPLNNGEMIVGQLCPTIPRWQVIRELRYLELDEEILCRPMCTLSNGEQTKLLLAILFLRDNHFLLIDEPTNHLDMHGREILGRYLSTKKGFILVSHDQSFLDACVDHVLSINRSTIQVQKGNCTTWLETRRQQDAYEQAQNDKLKKEIGRLEQTAREKASWASQSEKEKIGFDPTKTEKSVGRRAYLSAKSKKASKRAKAIKARQEAAIEEKSQLLKNVERADSLRIPYMPYQSEILVELKDVCINYGGGDVFSPCSFTIRRGNRVNLVGPNGAGKTSLLRMLAGEIKPSAGVLRLASNLVISYLPQDTSELSGQIAAFAERNNLNRTIFLTNLRKLDFPRSQFDVPMEQYSMGQKKKVLLAKSLCEPANLYLWDEPLNYIDLLSRGQIEELLLEFRPTILFVEHDKCFCERIATTSVELARF